MLRGVLYNLNTVCIIKHGSDTVTDLSSLQAPMGVSGTIITLCWHCQNPTQFLEPRRPPWFFEVESIRMWPICRVEYLFVWPSLFNNILLTVLPACQRVSHAWWSMAYHCKERVLLKITIQIHNGSYKSLSGFHIFSLLMSINHSGADAWIVRETRSLLLVRPQITTNQRLII